jgi:hypothetical protein
MSRVPGRFKRFDCVMKTLRATPPIARSSREPPPPQTAEKKV